MLDSLSWSVVGWSIQRHSIGGRGLLFPLPAGINSRQLWLGVELRLVKDIFFPPNSEGTAVGPALGRGRINIISRQTTNRISVAWQAELCLLLLFLPWALQFKKEEALLTRAITGPGQGCQCTPSCWFVVALRWVTLQCAFSAPLVWAESSVGFSLRQLYFPNVPSPSPDIISSPVSFQLHRKQPPLRFGGVLRWKVIYFHI